LKSGNNQDVTWHPDYSIISKEWSIKLKLILLINDNKDVIENINKIAAENYKIVCLKNITYLRHYVEEYMPSFLILSSEIENIDNIINYASQLSDCKLIITGNEGKVDLKFRGIFNGIVVEKLNNIKDLERIISLIDKIESDRRINSPDSKSEFRFINQQVISFYSVQGGTGKTSLVFNLAWYLKNINNVKILLVDLNFSEGPTDLQINLKLPLVPNLSLFMDSITDGTQSLSNSIVHLDGLNIDVLQPPLSICQSDKFSIDMLNHLIYLARNNYNFIIADVPNKYDNICLEMLNLSTISFIVVQPDVSAACRLSYLQKFLPADQKKALILNKVFKNTGGIISMLKSEISLPIYEYIPFIKNSEIKYVKNGKVKFDIIDLQSKISNLACQVM
jgi:MinD-like ATPase involved in chromosome partitioning or flagellar assembly